MACLGDQISEDDAWKLRHTLQNEPRVMLLATATSRFERDRPSQQGHVRVVPHPPLAAAGAGRLPRPFGNRSPANFWRATGSVPIQILTGGNLRLLTILSTFGARLSLRELMDDLVGLVDDHTGYFKSHLDALPAGRAEGLLGAGRGLGPIDGPRSRGCGAYGREPRPARCCGVWLTAGQWASSTGPGRTKCVPGGRADVQHLLSVPPPRLARRASAGRGPFHGQLLRAGAVAHGRPPDCRRAARTRPGAAAGSLPGVLWPIE